MLFLPKFLLSLVSLVILAAAAYLLWSWQQGHLACDPEGQDCIFFRDNWKLWTGLGLLAWSLLGGLILRPLLARADTDPLPRDRSAGNNVQSPTGATLNVEVLGAEGAPLIIFTHGAGLDSSIWGYARRDLAQEFRLVFWDLPGLGRSKPGKVDLAAFASDLKTVIGAAGSGPAVLVGHSIGGMTIQTLARDHPDLFGELIAGVVLFNTTYTNPLRTMIMPRLMQALQKPLLEPLMKLTVALEPLAWLSAWQSYLSGSSHLAMRLGFGRDVTRSQLNHATWLTTVNRPAIQAQLNLAMFNWDATGALKRIGIPILVVGGDVDIVTKIEASERIVADTGARFLRLEGANHMGFLEQAPTANAAIREFARTVQPALTS